MKVTTFNKKIKGMICEDLLIIDLNKFYGGHLCYFNNFYALYYAYNNNTVHRYKHGFDPNFYTNIYKNIGNNDFKELVYILNKYKDIKFLRELVRDESILNNTLYFLKTRPKDHYIKTIELFYEIRNHLRKIDLKDKLSLKEEIKTKKKN